MAAQLDRKKLRAIRREKSLTQEQLAEHCGISDRHMRSLETKRVNLSSNLLFQLRYLGIYSPNYLFKIIVQTTFKHLF